MEKRRKEAPNNIELHPINTRRKLMKGKSDFIIDHGCGYVIGFLQNYY